MSPALAADLVELVGWTAALLILASYSLVSAGRLQARSAAFQWMNVIGAGGFVLNSGWHAALPSAVLNVAWAAIGLGTLWSIRGARARPDREIPAPNP